MWFLFRVVLPMLSTLITVMLSEIKYDESVPTWAVGVLFLLWNLVLRGDDN